MHKKLSENLYYVGIINPNLRIFDIIMETKYGTSYNSYVIMDEKNVLIETAHALFTDNYIQNIQEVCPIEKIDYIILNHTEPDHTGSITKLLEINPNITLIASAAGLKNIKQITGEEYSSIIAKDGESLCIGKNTLQFIIAPNLHWPDSMFTYVPEMKTLFSCDFLGTHYSEINIMDRDVVYPDAYQYSFKNYYDAIFSPFKPFVISGLNKIKDLTLDMVCPSHGPVLTCFIQNAMAEYEKWSTSCNQEIMVSIFYVSAYGYTRAMAEHLKKCLLSDGIQAKTYDIICNDMCELKEILERSSAIAFGSPTINRDALKPVWDLLSVTDAIVNKGKPTAIFGSYGWSGEAFDMLKARVLGLKLKLVAEPVRSNFLPGEKEYADIEQLAKQIADSL